MIKIVQLIFLFCIILLSSCNLPQTDGLLEETKNAVWALPIINDEIKLQDILSNSDNSNTKVYSDEEGKITISYEGEVLREDASIVFPPIFGLGYISLSDTIFQLDLSQGGTENEIDSAVFLQDKLHFKFVSSSEEPLNVKAYIDEFVKDGEKLSQSVFFPGSPDGSPVEIIGENIDLNGYSLIGNENKITFHYEAIKENGEKVKIDQVAVNFNVLVFKFLQGYFPKKVRPVAGSIIPVNLYKQWLSGTMDFVDPKVSLDVENSFGFAVGADFNKMSLTTISGEEYDLEGEIIDNGIIFNYPEYDEIGEIKTTSFQFNKDNSNIDLIFEDRVAEFGYDIDAIANPMDDKDFIGHMTNESFYAVQLSVDVPLHLAINNLQLVDTLDFSLDLENELIDSIELKLILANNFPLDISTQLYLLDENNIVLDSIFQEGMITLEGGTYSGSSMLINVEDQVFFISFPKEKISNLLNAKRLLAKPIFNSTPDGEQHIWIYDTYGLKIKMGAKFSIE